MANQFRLIQSKDPAASSLLLIASTQLKQALPNLCCYSVVMFVHHYPAVSSLDLGAHPTARRMVFERDQA